ncbi:protein kinase C delta type-like [Leptodactylus fuscus]
MELATRGDLQDFIQDHFPFDTATVKFITAEVICGTEFLHRKDILHRDLKPRNILLTTDGHVKITDFGLAVTGVRKRTKEVCPSTPGYAAPEIVRRQEHGRAVDFFSIGVILYRLHLFMSPFDGRDPIDIQYSVLFRTPHYPESLTPDTVSIIKGLLCKNQFQRLGVNGEIRNHPFFSEVNWEDVEARRMAPPATLMAGSLDPNITENLDYAEPPNKFMFNPQKKFNEFSFVCPEWSKQYHPVIIQNKNWMLKILTKRSSGK